MDDWSAVAVPGWTSAWPPPDVVMSWAAEGGELAVVGGPEA
ncbi:hypothetical protein [Devosia sp.]